MPGRAYERTRLQREHVDTRKIEPTGLGNGAPIRQENSLVDLLKRVSGASKLEASKRSSLVPHIHKYLKT